MRNLSRAQQKTILLAVTLIAFLLRIYRLGYQSYWIDEGLTVKYANLSLPELWHALQTVRAVPPLYHVLTLYWAALLGAGEFSLRFLSLIFSLLAVLFIYRLGKSLGGFWLGFVAAFLFAISPYQIWHAQDARNYSMLTAASLMSMWGFINLWRRSDWRWWPVYIFGTATAILTHYHGLMIIGVQGLFFLLTWQRHRRFYLRWGASLLLMLLPYAAWMLFGSSLWQSEHWLPIVGLWQSYWRGAVAYSLNELVPPDQSLWPTLIFLVFYGLGLLHAFRRNWGVWRGREMGLFLLTYTLAPNIAAWAYSELKTPVYLERYLIVVQGGYLLTVSMGVLAIADWLRRLNRLPAKMAAWGSVAAILLLTGLSGRVLNHHYHDPVYAKPSWRQVLETIEAFSLPGDGIIVTGDGGELLVDYYYRGDLPVYSLFNTPVPSDAEALDILAEISAAHTRLWYTPYGVDIDPLLEGRLADNAYPAWHHWLGRKRLALYGTPNSLLDRVESLSAQFPGESGDVVMLSEVAFSARPVAAGDVLSLALIWQADTPVSRDYAVSLRLINPPGDVFARSDWPPLTATAGTTAWPVGEPVSDHRGLWIPPDVPPGDYLLQLVVYDPASGQTIGQPVTLPGITVTASQITPPVEILALPNQTSQPMGDLTLVGFAAPESIQPGQAMWLWLYWLAQTEIAPGASIRLTLSGGDQATTADFSPEENLGPVESWQPGQVRRAVYHFDTGPALSGNAGTLSVSLVAPSGDVTAQTDLTRIAFDVRARTFEIPPVTHQTDADFGSPPQLTLLGYNLPKTEFAAAANEALDVTLVWQPRAEITIDYTIFVQLLNEAGQVVAQIDRQPLAGQAPTTTWLAGEVLADSYSLQLPDDAPPGQYRLIAGLYNAATGQRLLLSAGADFVDLGVITLSNND